MADPTPNATVLTNGGRQSILEGIFTEERDLDRVRYSILMHLNNDDNDSFRQTSRTIFECLATRSSVQIALNGQRRLRHQADLLDRCERSWLTGPTGQRT